MWASSTRSKAVDDKTFAHGLKEPFGLVLEALGKPSANVPFIMPKRVADTTRRKQIDDYTGSGPFIFKKDEFTPGEKVVYVKNPNYMPRSEPPSGLAGRQAGQGRPGRVDRDAGAQTAGQRDHRRRGRHAVEQMPLEHYRGAAHQPKLEVVDGDDRRARSSCA